MEEQHDQLIFTQIPVIVIATNTFNCRIPIRYVDTAMLEFIQQLTSHNAPGFTTKIPIYHNDGTPLAWVKGSRLFPTEAGKKAGVTMRYPTGATVCEINGKTAFEIRREGAAAVVVTAELFAQDGCFLKWSAEALSGHLTIKSGSTLTIAGTTFGGNVFQSEVGIQIGEPVTPLPTAVKVALQPPT